MDRFTVLPDPASVGTVCRVCFNSPEDANTVAYVNINDGTGINQTSIQISLDDEGYGCADWTVPSGWSGGATFEHPHSDPHTIAIT